jgi:hypothetical protein
MISSLLIPFLPACAFIQVGSRRALLVRDLAVLPAFPVSLASPDTLWNGNILVALGAQRHALALLLAFLYFILCHNTAFLMNQSFMYAQEYCHRNLARERSSLQILSFFMEQNTG